jgi:O-antigen/teichoic acid export membrane protein
MSDASAQHPADLRRAFVRGTAWVFAGRWTIRALGLISTALLARLLSPADFGLVALAALVVAFIEVFLLLGVEMALIRHPNATREHWDTAWTLRVLQNVGTAALLVLVAPLAAVYFQEPRVTPVVWALAGGILVSGFGNIGVIEYNRSLRFDKEFRLRVAGKVLQLLVTVGAALWLRNYWALVAGTVAGYAIGVALSYVMHPFRPRLSLAKARELLGFSFRIVGLSAAYFAESRIDEVLLGRFGTNRALGLYSVASELGQLPVTEVAAPLNRSLMPALARLQGDYSHMNAAYLKVVSALALATLPMGVGMALVAEPFVRIALGTQWLEAVPLLQWLAFYGVCRGLYLCPMHALIACGRPGASTQFTIAGALLLAPLGYVLVQAEGALGMAHARVAVGTLVLAMSMFAVSRVTGVSCGAQLRCFARPAAATMAMAAALLALPPYAWAHPVAELAAKVLLGAVLYVAIAAALWHLMGRPDGGERVALETLKRRFDRTPTAAAGGERAP